MEEEKNKQLQLLMWEHFQNNLIKIDKDISLNITIGCEKDENYNNDYDYVRIQLNYKSIRYTLKIESSYPICVDNKENLVEFEKEYRLFLKAISRIEILIGSTKN